MSDHQRINLFTDHDVSRLHRGGGVIDLGARRLHLPAIFGFCGGVLSALRKLNRAIEENAGRQIWLLGEVIHNATVNRAFADAGVRILPETELERVFDLAAPDAQVVIPAFGLPKNLDERLRRRFSQPGQILDTTCGYVRRIWSFAKRTAAEGRTVVIHGKPAHPETRAILSRALTDDNAVLLIRTVEQAHLLSAAIRHRDVERYPADLVRRKERVRLDLLALVNQTTMLCSETRAIEQRLKEASREAGSDLVCCNAVCRATQMRQDAAIEICRQDCDMVLVVGGFTSSNTTQLYRLAASYCPTYFIGGADALTSERIYHFVPESGRMKTTLDWLTPDVQDIGILAGASCPACDIGDVIRRLKELNEKNGQPADR